MSRYIDAEKLVERIKASPVFPNMGEDGYFLLGCVCDLIEMQPTVDSVEVVRCKDCRFWDKQSNSAQGLCILSGNYPTGNWFCANGEKMDGEE